MVGVSENNIGPLPTTARPHRRDTGRTAGRRPYVSGGPKCFVRYVFWGQGPFSASGAIECRLREALRVKTWCRRSRRRHLHLPRGPGNYGCHRSRTRWGSLTDRLQSRSRGDTKLYNCTRLLPPVHVRYVSLHLLSTGIYILVLPIIP